MTFTEKQTNPTSDMHWLGDMQADYFYSNGIAGDKFFKHLKDNGSFLATKCTKCNKILFPARLYCEDCFNEIPEKDWIEVPASGTIGLFTIAKLDAHGEKLKDAKVIALIDIDNTDGSLLGIINSKDYQKDFTGLKVKAVLRPRENREGNLKDIKYWE